MASEAEELADRVDALNREVIGFVQQCDTRTWASPTPEEGWPVGVVAQHCAAGTVAMRSWLEAMLTGEGVAMTTAELDAVNAANAARWQQRTPAEVAHSLERGGTELVAFIRRLTPEEMERTAPFGPAHGAVLPVRRLAGVAAGHLASHLESMRGAVTASRPDPGARG